MICVFTQAAFQKNSEKEMLLSSDHVSTSLKHRQLFTFDALQCHNSNSGQCLDADPFADPFAWLRICICRVNPFPPTLRGNGT